MNLLYLGIAWLLGIVAADQWHLADVRWSAAVAFLTLLAYVYMRRRDQRAALLLACVCTFSVGVVRYDLAAPNLDGGQLAYYNDSPRVITLIGTVVGEPDVRDRSIQLRVAAQNLTTDSGFRKVDGVALVNVFRFPEIAYGSRVQITGNLLTPPESEDFSYKDYLARQRIYSVMDFPNVQVLEENVGSPIYAAIFHFKARAQRAINEILPDPQASLLSSVLLGNDNGFTKELNGEFRTVGLTHLIVVSGFQVTIVAGIVLQAADPLFGRKNAVWATSVMLVAYMLLVGAGVSVIRATIMGIAYLVGTRILGRSNATLGALIGAAVLLSAYNPLVVWDVGFQLSFAATLGLVLYSEHLDRWGVNLLKRAVGADSILYLILSIPWRAMLVSVAAQILTLPIIMYTFGRVSLLLSLPANALVVPAQPPIIFLGGLAMLLGIISVPLGQILGWFAWIFLTFTIQVIHLLAGLPLRTPLGGGISSTTVLIYYLVVGILTWFLLQELERRQAIIGRIRVNFTERAIAVAGALTAILAIAWANSQPDRLLHVAFFDVGQGDAIFIETPTGRQVLIDGGGYASIVNSHLGEYLAFWDKQLDLIIATHPDNDHVSALPGVFERYRVGKLITDGEDPNANDAYTALVEAAEKRDVPIERALAGQIITIGDGVSLEVLNPPGLLSDSHNTNSIVLRLVYGNFSVLLTGDADLDAEKAILAAGRPVQSLVLKVSDHGAKTATSPDFLAQVQPQIAIISVGRNNRFGLPDQAVVDRLTAAGVTTLYTTDLGTIEVMSDGSQMWWESRP